MPDLNKSSKKAARLGRGLGSLLNPDALNANQSPSEPVPTQKAPPASVDAVRKKSASGPVEKAIPTVEIKEENRIWFLSIDKLIGNKEQPRKDFTAEHLQQLAASIKSKGILQPITVRKLVNGQFEIIAGERRWRAAQLAGLHEVPVIIKKIDKQGSLELALIENIQRENLNPLEEAEAYDQLIKRYHLTQQEIAQRVGKERATISNSLRLLSLAEDVKNFLKDQLISVGHAKVLLTVTDHSLQKKLAKKAIQKKLSVRALEKQIKQSLSKEESKEDFGFDVSKRLIDNTKGELQKIMGRKVSVDYRNGKGKISVHYYSDEEFSEIIEKIKSGWKA